MSRAFGITLLCALASSNGAFAAPPSPDVDAEADAIDDGPDKPKKLGGCTIRTWICSWAPEAKMGEIGIHGGVLFPAPHHQWHAGKEFKQLDVVAPDVGARAAFFPIPFIGIEAEVGSMPTHLRGRSAFTMLYTVRGSLVAQLALWSITPFVTIGAGFMGISSPKDVLGRDIDSAVQLGGGVKFYINRHLMLRLDARDVLSYRRGIANTYVAHSPEILLGLSVTLRRQKTAK